MQNLSKRSSASQCGCHHAKSTLQVLNESVRERSYWQVVHDAQAVSLQVSIVTATVELFLILQTRTSVVPDVLLYVLATVAVAQVVLWTVAGVFASAVPKFTAVCGPAAACRS